MISLLLQGNIGFGLKGAQIPTLVTILGLLDLRLNLCGFKSTTMGFAINVFKDNSHYIRNHSLLIHQSPCTIGISVESIILIPFLTLTFVPPCLTYSNPDTFY